MRFEWDEQKAASNYRKHRVLFETAAEVFEDPHLIFLQDRNVDGEERWQAIGAAAGVMLLVVAHTIADDEDGDLLVRIISARRPAPHERRRYEAEGD